MEPNINGFTLKGLKTMMGRDGYMVNCTLLFNGYMVNCTLLFNGRQCGDFLDQGDGSEYTFYPAEGFTQISIENALRRFPLIDTQDKELDLPPIHWNIGILVDRLIGIKETLKELRKAQKKGYELAIVTNNKTGGYYTILVPPPASDETLTEVIDDGMRKKGIEDYSWKRYRSEDDLTESYIELKLKNLM